MHGLSELIDNFASARYLAQQPQVFPILLHDGNIEGPSEVLNRPHRNARCRERVPAGCLHSPWLAGIQSSRLARKLLGIAHHPGRVET